MNERVREAEDEPRAALAGLLTTAEREVLARIRDLVGRLRETLAASSARPDDLAALRQAAADLDELFLLVVVGEFNAGKSALINAVLGERVLPEGVTPTTAQVTLLRHGREQRQQRLDGLLEVSHPLPLLRDLIIVDTPGTNAVLRQHEELTRRFIPRADLVLFVTSADRPFTESERAFMELIRGWGKKLVLVLNKADLLQPEELREQLAFIKEQARVELGVEPPIFAVSARAALSSKRAEGEDERSRSWQESGFQAFEHFVRHTLDDRERIRLKLLTPLGVVERVASAYLAAVQERLEVLRADLVLSEGIEAQLELYRKDMRRDFEFRLHELDNLLHELRARGERFLESTLRLGRLLDLFNTSRIRSEFEREVVGDLPVQVDRVAQSLIDWMVEQDARLWRVVTEQVERRRAARPDEGPSSRLSGTFEYDRRALLASLGSATREVVARHDHRREAEALAESVREAVTRATLLEAGAVGLGAVTLALASSAVLDVTGLLAGGVLAGLGLYVLPLKRRQARRQFEERTEALRAALLGALRSAFEQELQRSTQRVRDALAPYDRFVRVEQERSERLREALDQELAEARVLRERLSRLEE